MFAEPQWRVRPASGRDLGALLALAEALGPGMTTLPANEEVLGRKIAASETTFAGGDVKDHQYILVLEAADDGRILGLSAVYPRVGEGYGFFSYKLTRLVQRSDSLQKRVNVELLTLSNDYTGATEVGSLAILPELRGSSAARLLARSRYMLIAAFPHLFADRVMAEMRGWQDEDGACPFWDAIGARFFDMPFAEADRLSAIQGTAFIAELMPKQPIYTALLPDAARAAIGRAHRLSARAMSMLMDEEFHYEAHVDVFDGGPQVHAAREKIRTIKDNRLTRALDVGGSGEGGAPLLLSNTELDRFRVVETHAWSNAAGVAAGETALRMLELKAGDVLRAAPGRAPRAAALA